MNCLLVMKIKWSLDINTGAVERSEAARACRLAGATVVGDDVIASTGYMKKQPLLQAKLHYRGGINYVPCYVHDHMQNILQSGPAKTPVKHGGNVRLIEIQRSSLGK